MANIPVNALLRVTTNNELDFAEWLDYHLALGFDRVYAFDAGTHPWLMNACEKRGDRVVLVGPSSGDWRKKSNIISSYVAHMTGPTWAVCLEDDEFIWLDFRIDRSVSSFINRFVGTGFDAMSVYVKYLSSEKPMKNRVGTLIDCFQHARQNPQGLVNPCSKTPNYTLTFFYVPNNQCRPMRGPLTPSSTKWRDSKGTVLNEQLLGKYLVSNQYNPDAYPIRGYKYGLKSGMEMGMEPGTCPKGYVVRDNNMLNARAALLNIPANEATEELFAKDEVIVEQPKLPKRELSPEESAELEVPIPLGKIDTYILYGYDLDTVMGYAVKAGYEDTVEHRAVIERIYNRECDMIVASSPIYTSLYYLDKEGGKTDGMISKELNVTVPALQKMRKCMAILDIPGRIAKKEAAARLESETDNAKKTEIVEKNDMTALTKEFDETVAASPISSEDAKRFDDKVEERRAKRREQDRKYKAKKKANAAAKKKALESKKPEPVQPKVDGSVVQSEPPSDDVDIDIGDTNLLNNTDLSAFGDLDA